MRQYIQCFNQVRNTIPRICLAAVIMAFSEGVTNKRLVGKMDTHNVETVSSRDAPEDPPEGEAPKLGAK